jgi:short-subunit dehydrogenase
MPDMLIVGATSAIARSAALAFGVKGWNIQMAGRCDERLAEVAGNLSARLGRPVPYFHFDALDAVNRRMFWAGLPSVPDALLCAVGLLGDQKCARHDVEFAETITTVNYSGLLPLFSQAAAFYEKRGGGLIIGISSVAGDRGRASNHTYGAAKAALATYLSGLRQSLASRGVRVVTVKPGFVRTPMTAGLTLQPWLTAEPEQIAADIVRAVEKNHDVVYTPWFWRWIMAIIKAIPEKFFKRINL